MKQANFTRFAVLAVAMTALLAAAAPASAQSDPPDKPDKPKMSAEQRRAKIGELTQKLVELSNKGDRQNALEVALAALDQARRLHHETGEQAASQLSLTNYNVACMFSLLAKKDEAFKHLDAAVDAGGFGVDLANQIENDTDFDGIRDDPRYAEAVKKAKSGSDQPGRRGNRGRGMMERMMRDDGAPKVGEAAPAFKLKSFDGIKEIELAGFQGKRPVVLFFGSYT